MDPKIYNDFLKKLYDITSFDKKSWKAYSNIGSGIVIFFENKPKEPSGFMGQKTFEVVRNLIPAQGTKTTGENENTYSM